jgi:hypothetical protein
MGGSANLSVNAGGSTPLSYQWRLNNISVPGATSSSLSLMNLQAASAGAYTVLVTNLYGSATSSSAALSILDVPVSFAQDPASIINGEFNIMLNNLTGQGTVVVQASTNLMQWISVYTNPPAFGQIQFTDSMTNSLIRYYRAVIIPPP